LALNKVAAEINAVAWITIAALGVEKKTKPSKKYPNSQRWLPRSKMSNISFEGAVLKAAHRSFSIAVTI